MTYAFIQDVPIDRDTYQRIADGLGDEAPDGMIIHIAVDGPQGGLRYIDVWDTQEQADRFAEERLHPVVHPMLTAVFGDDLPPEPDRVAMSVVHVWRG